MKSVSCVSPKRAASKSFMAGSGRRKKVSEISADQLQIRRAVRREREKEHKRKCLEQQKDALAVVQAAAKRAAEGTLKASQDEVCQLQVQVASLKAQLACMAKVEKEKATQAAMLKKEVARVEEEKASLWRQVDNM